ncbi:hypothetical protein [Bosea sp. OK403]|uniref:hypothetical protein n=1 Tax=Bosea sp. OK403 TaxID=1855286 RepID=UPI000B86B033|nr:hypothetical protein [Bosea sp. OK403]
MRIKVVILSNDRSLRLWLPWARKRLRPDWLNIMIETGGGKAKAKIWYLYQGVIEPSRFAEVQVNGQLYEEKREAA